MNKPADTGAYLRFAHSLADACGEAILRHFRNPGEIRSKGKAFDPVTQADRQAEAVAREMIAARYPHHAIQGEEDADRTADASSLRWILDPIDGTRAFIMGLPLWGGLIGLYDGDTPLLGLMHQPFAGERYEGSEMGAFLTLRDGTRSSLRARSCARLEEAILGATDPNMFAAEHAQAFHRLGERVRMRRFGGDCYLYCALAAGWLDLVVEDGLQPYDILPLIPIIEASGGVVTDWHGNPLVGGGSICAAGDAALHAQALSVLTDS